MARRTVAGFLAVMMVCVGFVQRVRAEEPAAASAATKTTVPVFNLDGPITESPAGEAMPLFEPPGQSLKELLERMNKAAKDPAVKAVVLVWETGGLGAAQIEEVRQAIGA